MTASFRGTSSGIPGDLRIATIRIARSATRKTARAELAAAAAGFHF